MSQAVRVELARRLTKSCLSSSNLVPQLPICLFHHAVNPKFRTEVVSVSGRVMNTNKQNKLSWRPIFTQSNSSQRKTDLFVADGEKNEMEIQGEQVDVASSSRFPLDDKKTTFQSAENSDKDFMVGDNVSSFAVTSSIGKHSGSIQVCSSLVRFIRGKEGVTQKEIERETGAKIILPSSWKEDSIIIEGGSAESVRRASGKILAIIDEVVKSPNLDYSHFISLPLAIYPELVDKLDKFRNSILGIPKAFVIFLIKIHMVKLGIDKSIFINPKTLHLTVLMLKLWNKDLVKAANQVMQSVSEKVIKALDARPLSIRLKGLECMKGSFPKARVLYAPIEEIGGEERLSCACQIIIDAFVDAGLVLERDAKHKLKFHATVMNVRHRKSYGNPRRRYNDSFDARTIADQYGSEDWGEYLIREAHLSERFAYDEKGYYHCCASIPFPITFHESL